MTMDSHPSTAPLIRLSTATDAPKRSCPPLPLLLLALISSSAAAAAFLSFPGDLRARRLAGPTVILVSFDGFRFGYQHKSPLPSISRLISGGTEAAAGLIPVFPTLTFPNHYSIATGLYPPHHGIVDNHFSDPATGARFSMDSLDPSWWLGHPIWETAANAALPAATFFWPGSAVPTGLWTCPPNFCHQYNKSTPFHLRVDTVLSYFDLPPDQIPSLITLYFEEPDLAGHDSGPDDGDTTKAVERVDRIMGRLIHGLETRGLFDGVHIILVGDHGMVGICRRKYVFLDDLRPWIDIDPGWVQSFSPLFALRPPPGALSPADIVDRMNLALSSGKVRNGDKLRVFLKEDLPERLHYSDSERIPPVIGLLQEGYKVEMNGSSGDVKECGGDHGYDNAFFSMRSVFVGHGPRFAKGRKVPSFENVEIYNVIVSILGLERWAAPNNGSESFADSILLPRA